MVRPVVAKIFSGDDNSLRKCIRPLASELLLQLGQDVIRASLFQIATSGTRLAFEQDLQNADRLLRHRFRDLPLSPVGIGFGIIR